MGAGGLWGLPGAAMNDMRAELRGMGPSLTAAVRRARVEEAERSDVIEDLRRAEHARLEALLDALRPVLAQVPEDIDLFDTGIVSGAKPRLFVDMIAFVDMGRDRRGYRFVQDTRHGRVTIAESERIEVMVDAVTAYIARRLVERDKALAGGEPVANTGIANLVVAKQGGAAAEIAAALAPATAPTPAAAPTRPQPRRVAPRAPEQSRWMAAGLRFVLEFLGAVALFVLLWAAAWGLWSTYLRALWATYVGPPPI